MKTERESHVGDGAVGQNSEPTEHERNDRSKIRQFGPLAAASLIVLAFHYSFHYGFLWSSSGVRLV